MCGSGPPRPRPSSTRTPPPARRTPGCPRAATWARRTPPAPHAPQARPYPAGSPLPYHGGRFRFPGARGRPRELPCSRSLAGVTRASAHRPRAGRSREPEPRPRTRRVTGRAELGVGGPARRRGVRTGRSGLCCAGAAVVSGWAGLVPFRPVSASVASDPGIYLSGLQRPSAALAGRIRLLSQLVGVPLRGRAGCGAGGGVTP